jgi:arylformamidase
LLLRDAGVTIDSSRDAAPALYRGMDRAALSAAYNNRIAVADSADWSARWKDKSAVVRASRGAKLDIRYGAKERERLDLYPSGAKQAPLFVFIHGGYWQRNDKDTFAFVAEGPVARGINVAVPGYTLAPQASLTEIVAEMEQALTFLSGQSVALGFDRDAIYVGGWSAGGHLTAAVARHPSFRGGMPISGVYDLEPIALTDINDLLSLAPAEIEALSPLKTLTDKSPPLRVTVGGGELPELRRQAATFTAAAQARGLPVALTELPGHHHFSILDELARPDGALTRMLVDLVATTKA